MKRKPDVHRYFLGCRPRAPLRRRLATLGTRAGQKVDEECLHLTLCVIAETLERDPFIAQRVAAALAGQMLSAFQVRLGRVRGGATGASIGAIGRQDSIQDFYDELARLLTLAGLPPLHRKAGLNAHITLGYDPCAFASFNAPFEWFPDELFLIESEVGLSRHNVLARWPLQPRRQSELPGIGQFEAAAEKAGSMQVRP